MSTESGTAKSPVAEALERVKALIDHSPEDARAAILALGEIDPGAKEFIALRQLYARSLYKDEDLVAPQKYEQAVAVLESDCKLATSADGETLGLAGAIYKRLWDHTDRRTHLESALRYYRQGFETTSDADGWLGVNTAFVLDLLAVQERRAGGADAAACAAKRFEEADAFRNEVLARLTTPPPREKNPWYFHASRAEALFGLGPFDEAVTVLQVAVAATRAWREAFVRADMPSLRHALSPLQR